MPTALRMARQERGWSHKQLRERLREEAARLGERLPGESSLHRMVVRWEQGHVVPAEFYRRLFCQVYDLPAERLGLPDDGSCDPRALSIEVATALLYAAPLPTDQIGCQPGRRLYLYVTAALDDPMCPELDTLASALAKARQDGPRWLDRRRLRQCELAARRAIEDYRPPRPTRPAAGTGRVPDWLAAGRLLGSRLAAASFGTDTSTGNSTDVAGTTPPTGGCCSLSAGDGWNSCVATVHELPLPGGASRQDTTQNAAAGPGLPTT